MHASLTLQELPRVLLLNVALLQVVRVDRRQLTDLMRIPMRLQRRRPKSHPEPPTCGRVSSSQGRLPPSALSQNQTCRSHIRLFGTRGVGELNPLLRRRRFRPRLSKSSVSCSWATTNRGCPRYRSSRDKSLPPPSSSRVGPGCPRPPTSAPYPGQETGIGPVLSQKRPLAGCRLSRRT